MDQKQNKHRLISQQNMIQGFAIFNQNGSNIKHVLTPQIKSKLNNQNWNWEHQAYDNIKWRLVFQNMTASSCRTLKIGSKCISNILKEIKHIHFSQIKQLVLNGNRISNVQSINFLSFQKLYSLNLSNNQIISLTAFHKLKTPQLSRLVLHLNPIKTIDSISKIALSCDNTLTIFSLQHFNSSAFGMESPCIDDLGRIIKLNIKQIIRLMISGQNRIKQQKVYEMLKNKYQQIKVKTDFP